MDINFIAHSHVMYSIKDHIHQ